MWWHAGRSKGIIYNKYYNYRKLPDALSFFNGKRFVPMVCIAWSVIISLILAVVWPVVQSGINAGKQVFGQDPLWLAWVTDLINYKDAGNMEAYKTLLTTVTPARFKVGQMIGATGLLLGVALAMYRRVDAEQKDSGVTVEEEIDGWRDGEGGGAVKDAKRLDYIFCNTRKKVKSSQVVCNGKNYPVVSDHYGVMIEVED